MSGPDAILECILRGKAVAFGPQGARSAICKTPLEGVVVVTRDGILGDEQGDPVHHGGPEKAVHQYPVEHYDSWMQAYPQGAETAWRAGGFGENFSTRGMLECDVCIGDVFRVGKTVLQVTQTRRPCWKLDLRFGREGFAREVQQSGRCGWYYRVLEPGVVRTGDAFSILARPHPEMTLERVGHLLHIDVMDRKGLEELAAMALLPERWRMLARRRLELSGVEDWSARLVGPLRRQGR